MPIRFTLGHLTAGSKEVELSRTEARAALDELLRELGYASDEHYQVFALNNKGAAIVAFDGGLLIYHRLVDAEQPQDLYCRPTTLERAVDFFLAHVEERPDDYLPAFTRGEPASDRNFVLDTLGKFPLHMAAYAGNGTLARRLVEAGADVNQRDDDGITPIMNAAIEGHADLCAFLIDRGADLTVRDPDGWSLLRIAKNWPAVAALLKNAGAPE